MLIAMAISSGVTSIPTSAVAVAVPVIHKEFNASIGELQWTLVGFSLAYSALLVLAGRLADVYGRKVFFLGGTVIYTLGALGAAVAPDPIVLIISVVIMGVGAAVLTPASLSIITDAFEPAQRGTAIGIWAASSALVSGLGPALGGILAEWDWRVGLLDQHPVRGRLLRHDPPRRARVSRSERGQAHGHGGPRHARRRPDRADARSQRGTGVGLDVAQVDHPLRLGRRPARPLLRTRAPGAEPARRLRLLPEAQLPGWQRGAPRGQLRARGRPVLHPAVHAGGAGLLGGQGRRTALAAERHPGHRAAGRRADLNASRATHPDRPRTDPHRPRLLPADAASTPTRATTSSGRDCSWRAAGSASRSRRSTPRR